MSWIQFNIVSPQRDDFVNKRTDGIFNRSMHISGRWSTAMRSPLASAANTIVHFWRINVPGIQGYGQFANYRCNFVFKQRYRHRSQEVLNFRWQSALYNSSTIVGSRRNKDTHGHMRSPCYSHPAFYVILKASIYPSIGHSFALRFKVIWIPNLPGVSHLCRVVWITQN